MDLHYNVQTINFVMQIALMVGGADANSTKKGQAEPWRTLKIPLALLKWIQLTKKNRRCCLLIGDPESAKRYKSTLVALMTHGEKSKIQQGS